jgi:4-amino-4-deoxy-L-arabinose transferase-like glycosyltransferase
MPVRGFVIAILILAAALRLWGLNRQSLWFDEAVVASVAMLQTHEIVPTIQWAEKTPPLHYLLVHYWIMVFGPSEVSLRMPSLIAGVASVGILYLLLKRVYSEWAGVAGALILALSPYHIHYSQEARAYSLMVCWALWATFQLVKLIEKPTRNGAITYALLLAALLYTHLYGAMVVAAHVVTYATLAALRHRGKMPLWMFATTILAAFIAYAPWMPTQWRWMHLVEQGFWMKPFDVWEPIRTYTDYAGSRLACGVLLVCIVLAMGTRPRHLPLAVLLPLAMVPVAPAILVSLLMHPIFIHRYGVAAIVGVIGLAACGIVSLRWTWARLTLGALAAIATAAAIRYPIENPDWRGVGRYLEASMKRGDVAAVTNSNVSILYGYYVNRPDVPSAMFDGDTIPLRPPEGTRVWLVLDGPLAPEEQIVRSGPWRVLARREFLKIVVLELEPDRP